MGPLTDIKVVEFAGLGPVPFSGMVLSDLGAEVVKMEPFDGDVYRSSPGFVVINRGKKSLKVDFNKTEDIIYLYFIIM